MPDPTHCTNINPTTTIMILIMKIIDNLISIMMKDVEIEIFTRF